MRIRNMRMLCVVLAAVCLGLPGAGLAEDGRPLADFSPAFLLGDDGEYTFHGIPWGSTAQEVEAALGFSIGDAVATNPEFNGGLWEKFSPTVDVAVPGVEEPQRSGPSIERFSLFFWNDGLVSVYVLPVQTKALTKEDMAAEIDGVQAHYAEVFGDISLRQENAYKGDGWDHTLVEDIWLGPVQADGDVSYVKVNRFVKDESLSMRIDVGITARTNFDSE